MKEMLRMTTPPNSETQRSDLRVIAHCPLCLTVYPADSAALLQEEDDTFLFHVSCRNCANSVLAVVDIYPTGIESYGIPTDLACHEVSRFSSGLDVSTDDVIAVHHVLETESLLWEKMRQTIST